MYNLAKYYSDQPIYYLFFFLSLLLDTKNSSGLVGCIEEVAHNAICIYWNPLESPAKVTVIPVLVLGKKSLACLVWRKRFITR